MGHGCFGSSSCCNYSYDYYYEKEQRVQPKPDTYSVLVKTNHNLTKVKGLSKPDADGFLADWSSGKKLSLMLKGTNVCFGVRSSCITEITISKES